MYQATINNRSYKVLSSEAGVEVDGELLNWDIVPISEGHYHILFKNKSYRAEVLNIDAASKSVVLKMNGKLFTINLKSKFDLLLEQMGINNSAASKLNYVKAPMPGLIIELKIKAGDLVKKGDVLLILEAMKMENILKSPGDGLVKEVKVRKGDNVEKSQVLIEF
jgi:biotin carboxyl carrier protein